MLFLSTGNISITNIIETKLLENSVSLGIYMVKCIYNLELSRNLLRLKVLTIIFLFSLTI
jgi:hypothetical protein